MKKTAAAIITLILVLTLGSTTVFAVGRDRDRQNCRTGSFVGTGTTYHRYYTDENNDGICDYYTGQTEGAETDTSADCPYYEQTCTGTAQQHRYAGNQSSGSTGHHAGNGCRNQAGCKY